MHIARALPVPASAAGSSRPGFASGGHSDGARRLAGAVTWLAGLATLAIVFAFPVAYALSAYSRLTGLVQMRAQLYASQVSDAASQSPGLWNAFFGAATTDLDRLAIARADDPKSRGYQPEHRWIRAGDGALVLDIPSPLPVGWPQVLSVALVMQNDNRLGTVEVARSLRPALLRTFGVSAASLAFGCVLFALLRTVPLRLMNQALDRAAFLSAHDQLTGLPNRTLLGDRLEQALVAGRRSGAGIAMHCLDLDRFKEVNDTLGHPAGDALLRIVAQRVLACLRETDTLARLGGDEFAVIQPGVRRPYDAEVLATRLIEAVREPAMLEGQQVFIGLSIGIALSSRDTDATELTKAADVALYKAKAAGRGGFCFFAPEMNDALRERHAMENDLRAALRRGELTVHYQPQIGIASERIVGAEALMRWNRPGHAPVSPATFVPIAEETGLIVPMGAWLLEQACCEAARWPAATHVAVNVSPVQFRFAGFSDTVRQALSCSGLDPHRLELEVTEGILLNDTEETLAILSELRAMGVRLAMDDFGTGYASLGYLQRFHFDKIKIDRSFVENLGVDPNAAAIIRAVVGLCDSLGMQINAEGVESAGQLSMLRSHGCHEVQGYYYWRPMPAESFSKLLVEGRQAA